MLKPIKFTLVIVFCFSFFSQAINASAFEDAIIAVVNDETITFKDYQDYIKSTYIALVAQGFPDDELKAIMQDMEVNGLRKLTEDKLMLSKANEIQLEVRDKAIEDKIEEIKSRYKSDQDFLQGLIDNGASVTDLRNKIIEQLKIKYVIDYEVRSKIVVNPQEVTDYYENNMESFNKKEQANFESIFISFDEDKEIAQKKAEEALALIDQNENFLEVSQKYSDTPSIGIVEREQLLGSVEKIVFHLRKDEISPIIEMENGLYIFKMIDRMPAQLASLDEVKNLIQDFLYKQKFQDQYRIWLEDLKEEAYVEIKE